MAKSMKPGGGGRFAKLKGELAARGDVRDPGAVAAAIGRKKYGAHKMAQFSANARKGSGVFSQEEVARGYRVCG